MIVDSPNRMFRSSLLIFSAINYFIFIKTYDVVTFQCFSTEQCAMWCAALSSDTCLQFQFTRDVRKCVLMTLVNYSKVINNNNIETFIRHFYNPNLYLNTISQVCYLSHMYLKYIFYSLKKHSIKQQSSVMWFYVTHSPFSQS